MISMKTKARLRVDFGWIGPIPDDNRKPGESKGHLSFFVECMQCDKECDAHQLNCDSEDELITLYELYAERLKKALPFKMFREDFVQLAKNTWNDPAFQAEKGLK